MHVCIEGPYQTLLNIQKLLVGYALLNLAYYIFMIELKYPYAIIDRYP